MADGWSLMADVYLLHHHRIFAFYIHRVRTDYQFLFFILYRCAVSESVSFRYYARESGVASLIFCYRYGFRFHNCVVYSDHHLFTDGIPCCDRQLTSYVRPQTSLSAAGRRTQDK